MRIEISGGQKRNLFSRIWEGVRVSTHFKIDALSKSHNKHEIRDGALTRTPSVRAYRYKPMLQPPFNPSTHLGQTNLTTLREVNFRGKKEIFANFTNFGKIRENKFL